MRKLLLIFVLAPPLLLGQFMKKGDTAANSKKLAGKPVCTATVTTNCVPNADASGNVSIGATVLPLPVTVATTSPQSPTSTAFVFNNTAGALTVNLPAVTASNVGIQICVRNYTGKSGAITIDAPAATSIDVDGANGTAGATLVSGGALGDAVCVVGVAAGQYVAYTSKGTWTNN